MNKKEDKDNNKNDINEDKKENKRKLYHLMTETEKQALQIERLMKNPDKEIDLNFKPGPMFEDLKPIQEINNNVQGSSAGAGSGEFHVYRASRRREYTRLAIMEAEVKKEKEDAEYKAKIEAIRKLEEEKTAKKRAKRQKRKNNNKIDSEKKINEKNEESEIDKKKFKMKPNLDVFANND